MLAALAPLSLSALLAVGVAGARVVTGTPGNDLLVGTARPDSISGLAGHDVLDGRAGADFLDGGAGRDVIRAGPGDDRVAVEYDGRRDVVRCGPGRDVVNADLVDAVASDCELVGRRVSRDPYENPESQHETEVEPDSFTFGSTTVAAFQVGRRRAGGATNIGFAVSRDDGRTWRSGLLPGLTAASRPPGANALASDPVVAYDAAHGVWLVSSLALAGRTTRLTINWSTDGGSWSPALVALEETVSEGISFDKNWIACDNSPTSPFFGRCYLAYTHASEGDRLEVAFSDDGGLSWSLPASLGARPAVGAFPVVRPTGELVVVHLWESGRLAVAASRSADGGISFAPAVRIADVSGACGIRGFRDPPLPSVDVDGEGRIWAAWHSCAAPGAAPNAVFVARSEDGSSWSSPRRVTSGRGAVLPALGVDVGSGRIAIAFHRVGARVDVELVESVDDGATWRLPRRLSARSMALAWMPATTSGRMLGDYISVHYASGRPLVVWVLASPPAGRELRQAVYATRG